MSITGIYQFAGLKNIKKWTMSEKLADRNTGLGPDTNSPWAIVWLTKAVPGV